MRKPSVMIEATPGALRARYITVNDLLNQGDYTTFRLKGGRVEWEAISFRRNSCYISRMVDKGGKPFLMGLRYQGRYIDPDTLVEIVIP